jgi:hypothetical protein
MEFLNFQREIKLKLDKHIEIRDLFWYFETNFAKVKVRRK